MPQTYRQNFTVLHSESDPWDRMTPGAALRRIQEISTAQCEELGFDEDFYRRTHTVFFLSKLSFLKVGRMPALGEAVTLETRAYGMRKAAYHRVTSLHAQNGEKLCEADTRWVLVDIETRRILRRPLEAFSPYFSEEPGAEEHPMHLPKPGQELRLLAELRAAYSLCDRNAHINNTRYADLMCDHLPIEELRARAPRQMLFNYHSEIPLSAAFTLTGETFGAGDGYYFAAGSGGGKNFEGFVRFD